MFHIENVRFEKVAELQDDKATVAYLGHTFQLGSCLRALIEMGLEPQQLLHGCEQLIRDAAQAYQTKKARKLNG